MPYGNQRTLNRVIQSPKNLCKPFFAVLLRTQDGICPPQPTNCPWPGKQRSAISQDNEVEMDAIERIIVDARSLLPLRGDEDADALQILPPTSDSELTALREGWRSELPKQLVAFLQLTRGFEHPSLEWRPSSDAMSYQAGFGPLFRISHYGNGDGFALAPRGEDAEVWWVGHDPWYLVRWAPSLVGFLELWLARARQIKNLSSDDWELWSPAAEAQEVREPIDAVLTAFIAGVPAGSHVYDLRVAVPGTEIPFGRLKDVIAGAKVVRQSDFIAFLPRPRPWWRVW
jgi:hypothetical protein